MVRTLTWKLAHHGLIQKSPVITSRSTFSTRMTAYEEMSHYWAKNRQLKRPLSPHLSVFKFHLTMAISITNRITASAQQAILTGAPIVLMCMPGNFTHYFQTIKEKNIATPIIQGLKFIVAFPFAFHLMAGLRHLVWDAGVGFGKAATYQGGIVVLAGTVALTLLMMLLRPSLSEERHQ